MGRYIIVLGVCLVASHPVAVENPSVTELLDKYAATQDNLQSFILKCETSGKTDYQMIGRTLEPRSISEVRYDGNRYFVERRPWGRHFLDPNKKFVPRDKAPCQRFLWDGKRGITYTGAVPGAEYGRVIINRTRKGHEYMITGVLYGGGPVVRGFLPGDAAERIDSVLRRANKASVRSGIEEVGESNCYVIDAKTEHGDYTVWIDPSRGHNILKAEVRRFENNLYQGISLRKGNRVSTSLKDVRLKKVQGVWVPVEGHLESNWLSHKGTIIHEKHHVITEMTLNPDHDALRSFEPDFIRNGALVAVMDIKGITYRWQDGKLIPNIDEAVIDEIDKMAEEIMAETIRTKSTIAPMGATVSELLKKYAETQDRLRSFIAKGESTIEYIKIPRQSGRMQKELCEFRTDGERVNHRGSVWDKLLSKDKALCKFFLWDGESFIQYRQGSQLTGSAVFVEKNDESKKRMIATEYKGAPLMGICGGDYDRIDSILRKTDNISLRQKTEQVGNSQCYVIDAVTKRGEYRVWIDPEHGYNIAKIEQKKRKGDLIGSSERVKIGMLFLLKNVRFEKIDEVWVPVEADMKQYQDDGISIIKWHHKRTKMTLNPDHKALGSFVQDDIPEGTKVTIPGNRKIRSF